MTVPGEFATGKLPPDLLREMIGLLPTSDPRLVVGPGVGEDAAVIDIGDRYLVAKTDPITFATDRLGWYAVHVNANDVATMGATPKWFLATVLLPERGTDRALVETIFRGIADACESLGLATAGGHTEITSGLDRPILIGQMLGEVEKDRLVTTAGALVGDAVLMTKGIAVEGGGLVAHEKEAELLNRGYSLELLRRVQDFLTDPGISVVAEARVACSAAEIHSLHDPTEGGLATGIHEVAAAAGVGMRIDGEAVPVLPEVESLCREFGLDPRGVIASGTLLLTCAVADAQRVVTAIESAGSTCVVIGTVTPPDQGVVWVHNGSPEPLPLFVKDEVTKLFA